MTETLLKRAVVVVHLLKEKRTKRKEEKQEKAQKNLTEPGNILLSVV